MARRLYCTAGLTAILWLSVGGWVHAQNPFCVTPPSAYPLPPVIGPVGPPPPSQGAIGVVPADGSERCPPEGRRHKALSSQPPGPPLAFRPPHTPPCAHHTMSHSSTFLS